MKSLKNPNLLKFLNAKVTLIAFGVTLVLVLFTFAVVKQVQAERRADAVAAQEAAKQAETEREYKVRISQLEQSVEASKTAETRFAAVCDYVKATNAARRVAVPPLCTAPKL